LEKDPQDDLFDLIHCLDPAEKGYFSRFAQRHVLKDGNNYEQLFQVMAKMPAYNADALGMELKRLGIASPLAAAKNHLKSIILKAMRDYNSGRTTHSKLLEGLENLAFFYEKKQYDLLRKEIKRLKKTAQLHSEHHILFKIGDYERKLHKETARRKFVEGMEEILAEMEHQARAFQNQLQFGHLLEKMFVIHNKSGADREQAINALLTTELLSAEENAITPMARIYYHQIHGIAHMVKGQYLEAQRKYGAVLSLCEAAPHLIEEFPALYRRAAGNYLQICGMTKDYTTFETMLVKVRNSPASTNIDKAEIFSIGHNAELLWRTNTHAWEAIAVMIPSLEQGLQLHSQNIGQGMVLAFQYHIAIYYFLSEAEAACRKWLREITEAPRTEQRMDIQRIAKILRLLLVWKEGDVELLEYEHRAVARYFENWGGGKVEKAILDALGDLMLTPDKATQKQLLLRTAEKLASPPFKGLFGSLVIRAWLVAQATGDLPQKTIHQLENGN
jgi:hypothetical protein